MAKQTPELLQMVRVCQEFHKYIGNDNCVIYNIDSQHAPKFHIHPQLLANNFFELRKQFCQKLKEIVQTIATKDELLEYLEEEEIAFMLNHFGIQKIIQQLKKYKMKLTQLQPQHFDEPNNKSQQQSKLTTVIISEKVKKKSKTFIIWTYMHLYNLRERLPKTDQTIYCLCLFYLLIGLYIDTRQEAQAIYKIFHDSSVTELYKMLESIKSSGEPICDHQSMDKKALLSMCNELRSWTANGVNGILQMADECLLNAVKLAAEHFFNYHSCKLCHSQHIDSKSPPITELLSIVYNFQLSKVVGVVNICINNDLIGRVNELIALSTCCIENDEPFIAARMLKCAYKLSAGYIEHDEFDEDFFEERIEFLDGVWWDRRCNHCNLKCSKKKRLKHKACTGCMKVVYCSTKCQKVDWNAGHRTFCNMSWRSIYGALKMAIFDRI